MDALFYFLGIVAIAFLATVAIIPLAFIIAKLIEFLVWRMD